MISVQYVGNPEGNNTTHIHLEGRPDLILGGPPGDVTQPEYDFLTSRGYRLTIVGSGGTDPTPNAGPITLAGGVIVRSFDGVAVPLEGRVGAVESRRLDQWAAPTSAVALGAQKITGLADPTSPQDAATKAYADGSSVGNIDGGAPDSTYAGALVDGGGP